MSEGRGNVVFDSKELKIVNIVAHDFVDSKLYDAEWPTPIAWLLTPFWS